VHTIPVPLGERAYEVCVGQGLLAELGPRCAALGLQGRAAIVVDDAVAPHYLEPVQRSLERAGFQPVAVRFGGGDPAKTLSSAEALYGELIRAEFDRRCWVVALGGGVVGDLAGFVAATFLRGIDYVQVPTTLLAQVDASVGGKTAVNHPLGKNLVGAFHQPRLVLIDTGVLGTLPRRELVSGMAEVVKHAVVRDAALFARLEQDLEAILARRVAPAALDWLVARNVAIKAAVVAADEREADVRAVLNYGHTVGHAIEAATAYARYRHGEAVALGMAAAGALAVGRGLCSVADRDRQDALLRRLGLPEDFRSVDVEQIVARTRADKKRAGGRLRLVVPRRLGHAEIVAGIADAELRAAIRHAQSLC